ncbi:MAG: transposase [Eubacteriaceae bacterium]|nr:transposase [Eubacteriaceae bacterium]
MKASRNIPTEKEMEQDFQSATDVQLELKNLFASTIEQMLEAEMDEYLGYAKNSIEGNNSGNSRNGYNYKTIISSYGECRIAVPRDRNGEFKPRVVKKRQTLTDGIEQKIIAMYAKGMWRRDIEDSLHEIYGAKIPNSLVSKIEKRLLSHRLLFRVPEKNI